MKNKFKKELLFIIPSKNELPFNNLKHVLLKNFNKNYNLIELPYFRFGAINREEEFKFFENDKCVYYKKNKNLFRTGLLSLIFHFYFSLKETSIFIKNFLKVNKDIIVITQGLKCFIISLVYKLIFNKKISLVNFTSDIISENYKFFGTGLSAEIKNIFFLFYQKIIKQLSFKSDLLIYESLKLLNHDKKKFNKKFKYILIEPSLIQTNIPFSNKKIKFLNHFNICVIGNLVDDGHLLFLEKLFNYSKKLLKIHIIGGDADAVSKYKEKFPFFYFYGYLKNIKKLNKILDRCSFGSAFYNISTKEKKIIPSGKINFYITNNLPILSSKYSNENKIINKFRIGISSNNVKSVLRFIKNFSSIQNYKKLQSNLSRYKKNKNYNFHMTEVIQKIFKTV
jgi:hypothetical protein